MKLFESFFMGGYECADIINRSGERVDLLTATGHDLKATEDYNHLVGTGIKTVREGLRWSVVEPKPYVYDFSEVKNRIEAARETEVQQVWDLCHFGYPDDLMPTHPKFSLRFSALCYAFAEFYRNHCDAPLIVTPINDISFLSWHSGEVRGTTPFAHGISFDIKYHLCKAAINGIKALLDVDPGVRILLSEPLLKVHPMNDGAMTEQIKELNENQFQVMDIIGGYQCPELGGDPKYLDILGFSYYHNSQWEFGGEVLSWKPTKSIKRIPLSQMLHEAWLRYKRPMLLSGTGHNDVNKGEWLKEVTNECITAMLCGVDLQGICLYPLIDRPDWDKPEDFLEGGLWEIPDKTTMERVINQPYLDSLISCQYKISNLEYLKGARVAAPEGKVKITT